ncbi:MAG: GNAT family N-acetyltransferase, partial [Candidatus Tectomicrobia bacterium]|nr:GNAT family N-acetyltransferase [Candidatus Tectomicrobia bacterium]
NCMVALERQQPVGVVVSTRRDAGVWIQALGCQPAFQRRGIAAQLVEALIRKVAIQHAPVITVDVPVDNQAAVRFFEAVHFAVQGRYVSYQGALTPATGLPGDIASVAPSTLLASYASYHTALACWERNADALTSYGALPQGYAYALEGNIQGYLLHIEDTILDLAIAPQADALQTSAALLGRMHAAGWTQATLRKAPAAEPVGAALLQLGFRPTAEHLWMGQVLR